MGSSIEDSIELVSSANRVALRIDYSRLSVKYVDSETGALNFLWLVWLSDVDTDDIVHKRLASGGHIVAGALRAIKEADAILRKDGQRLDRLLIDFDARFYESELLSLAAELAFSVEIDPVLKPFTPRRRRRSPLDL